MMQTCRNCSRVNPAEAVFCHHDGSQLGDRPAEDLKRGARPFSHPLIFPSGRECRTFDELAIACHDCWSEAVRLLHQGYLEAFLRAIGRTDLAALAHAAAREPDPERGLDQLLGRLPTAVLTPPRLAVSPCQVNLGQLRPGQERHFELHLQNQGMRLLQGVVSLQPSSCLAIGEAPGGMRKLFQCESELALPIRIQASRVRAQARPFEERLLVESNGGTQTVAVRLEVPVLPFPEGVLAGARSPRELAEKARASPSEAAALFEAGAVARWYAANGWAYPVRGPAASGLGAVQQFFEALGLASAPAVEVLPDAVRLTGAPGQRLEERLHVTSPDRRPVYAHARSDVAWLEVGRARANGKGLAIPLVVSSVPARPGEEIHARVTVQTNGNQQTTVPVCLVIGPTPAPERPPRRRTFAATTRVVPALALVLALVGLAVADLSTHEPVRGGASSASGFPVALRDPEPRIAIKLGEEKGRFGIVVLREHDPANPERPKRLTYDEQGGSNNTCLKVDGEERLFGLPPGHWWRAPQPGEPASPARVQSCTWEYPQERLRVTQTVELVPGEQTRVLDTCVVRYALANFDQMAHRVGLRVLLDTFIGANDGVPFQIAGNAALVQTQRRFGQKEIPAFVRAMERPDPRDPGTVALLGLRLQGHEAPESALICRWPGNSEVRWDWPPRSINEPADEKPDSCVALYWAYRRMEPGERRDVAFTYGLGTMSGGSGRIGVACQGATRPGGVFTVTAYVKEPTPGQRVRLSLPDGLSLEAGEAEEKPVAAEAGRDGQTSWRVRAERVGEYELEVRSGTIRQAHRVSVNAQSIFD